MLKELREIAIGIAVMAGIILFGLIFYGLVHMSDTPCVQQADEGGVIENFWCAEKPKWVLPAE